MELRLEILNNLCTYSDNISKKLVKKVEDLIQRNPENSIPEDITELMNHGLSIIYYNNDDDVVAFGMIIRNNNLYEAKYLSVDPYYKEQGLYRGIYDIREKVLREMGIREIYTETQELKSSIMFHKSMGYYELPSPTKLVFTRFMKKDL